MRLTPVAAGTALITPVDPDPDPDPVGSSDASLSDLTISAGRLDFASGTPSYGVSVGYEVDTVTLTPTVAHSGASVTVDRSSVASGSATRPVALTVGATAIRVVVTAEDRTSRTYMVTVTRPGRAGRAPLDVALSAAGAPAEGGAPVTVVASLDEPALPGGTVVSFSVAAASTVVQDEDFRLWPARITIAAGRKSGEAEITPIDDAVDDDGETVVLSTTNRNPEGGVAGDAAGTEAPVVPNRVGLAARPRRHAEWHRFLRRVPRVVASGVRHLLDSVRQPAEALDVSCQQFSSRMSAARRHPRPRGSPIAVRVVGRRRSRPPPRTSGPRGTTRSCHDPVGASPARAALLESRRRVPPIISPCSPLSFPPSRRLPPAATCPAVSADPRLAQAPVLDHRPGGLMIEPIQFNGDGLAGSMPGKRVSVKGSRFVAGPARRVFTAREAANPTAAAAVCEGPNEALVSRF